jgi:hypothetical protein
MHGMPEKKIEQAGALARSHFTEKAFGPAYA